MRRYIPGLHSGQQDLVSNLDGLFFGQGRTGLLPLASQKPFLALRFTILEPAFNPFPFPLDVKHISCFVKNTANMRAGFTSEGLEVVDLVRDTKHSYTRVVEVQLHQLIERSYIFLSSLR